MFTAFDHAAYAHQAVVDALGQRCCQKYHGHRLGQQRTDQVSACQT